MKSNLAEQTTHTFEPTEHWMTTWDGTQLFYRSWLPATPARQAIILFHRGHEHSGRFQELAEHLDLAHTAVFAWDARGHGRSPGERGYATDFSCLVKDADTFVRHISETYRIPVEDMAVVAQSVGSVIVAVWVHDYAPPIRAMVLAVPAFRVKLYVPMAIPGLRLWERLRGKCFVKSYVKARLLTHDKEQARRYANDPLIERAIAVNILLGLRDASTRIVADAGAIRTPTLVFVAGADWVVEQDVQRKFFGRLSSTVKELYPLPGFYHDVFHEKDRHIPFAKTRDFLFKAFETPRNHKPLLAAHHNSYTRTEYDELSKPLSVLSPQYWSFAFQKLLMRAFGRLSEGIRVGWQTGFDSGESLNYVYENRAHGFTPIGRLLDRLYLDSIGWKGIRQRKVHIERILRTAINKTTPLHKTIHIVDIASGPGRYLLDAIQAHPDIHITALLRDRSVNGLAVGRQLADQLGIRTVRYEEGDAFDQRSLAALSPRPHIAVVSGLYELFSDNDIVLKSLKGLASAIEPDGYLIYTNQPWHPQVEMIARVLTNRDKQPWIMRRRTQEEMDDLIQAAGFEKLTMEIDEFGIFTVSLARRRPSI